MEQALMGLFTTADERLQHVQPPFVVSALREKLLAQGRSPAELEKTGLLENDEGFCHVVAWIPLQIERLTNREALAQMERARSVAYAERSLRDLMLVTLLSKQGHEVAVLRKLRGTEIDLVTSEDKLVLAVRDSATGDWHPLLHVAAGDVNGSALPVVDVRPGTLEAERYAWKRTKKPEELAMLWRLLGEYRRPGTRYPNDEDSLVGQCRECSGEGEVSGLDPNNPLTSYRCGFCEGTGRAFR